MADETTTVPQPQWDGRGWLDTGPRDVLRDQQNPDLLTPPPTDAGTLPNLRFSFSDAHTRIERGGWTREVTQRELPIATELAGVDMALEPGAYRELHWHKQSEWAYVLRGSCRISAVDQEGRTFLDDVRAGDLWFFPQGVPHHIQALDEGVEFLLVFDDGAFSENGTFLISDFFAHTPREVLAKNFGWTPEQLERLPEREKYIFAGQVPPPLEQDRVISPTGDVPRTFSHRMLAQEPQRFPGGRVRVADVSNFAASTTICAALVEIDPGGLRELHWHPTDDEWQYYISGQGRMGVFASSGLARTFDFRAGDVGYVPFAYGHYIENLGSEPLVFLEMFRKPRFEDISLAQWMALTPAQVVADTLNLPREMVEALPKVKRSVVG
ncbi:oxalate decarboxylase family bicupin [Micromonospora globbae]|uniref:Cupin domain-containing protein n=1 Tax=Micromonospora globbae TaxID=1894969 RepID=A0A420F7L3_9ACTN|nr:oxalate decarboxylase family bicupin [Micromonospora globbae]RKF28928.1 cupin domain-containing protein [Micromonospora globbae]WTF83732.1 oxalate decarboxylase family bicupin [Micromonospora globbae]